VSGEVRTLRGPVFGDIIDGLHGVLEQLDPTPFALVGGVAVLVHVPGHRVTEDIDSAVRGDVNEIRERLLVVAALPKARDATVVMPNGVPVDVLADGYGAIRSGLGRRTAKRYALRWAIETAELMTVEALPAGSRGRVTLPVARPSALIGLKTVAIADPRRGDKRATDLLDVWRLLSDAPIKTAELMEELRAAPAELRAWVKGQLTTLFADDPANFRATMATGLGTAQTVEEIRELWAAAIEPGLG
jgi:hypothetical protein